MSIKSILKTKSFKHFLTFLFVTFLFVGSFFVVNRVVSSPISLSSSSSSSPSSLSSSFKLSSTTNSASSSSSSNISSLSLRLDFSTFFANSSGDAIVTDNAGNVYVVGTTENSSLPVKNAFQSTYGGLGDAFVAKFNSTGSLVFCTYFGGSLQDDSSSLAIDPAGNLYVTGRTISTNFPTKNAFDSVHESGQYPDAFVAKFSATGSLIFSTFLGGNNNDGGNSITVDNQGNCYVTGPTSSSNFPTKNAYQSTFIGGHADIFISKFSPNGTLLYSTYFGGTGDDFSYSIAVDNASNVYITGTTSSIDFPTKNAFQPSFNSYQSNEYDAFVSKFSSNGSLVFSTYLGGSSMDDGDSIAVTSNGTSYITGTTQSTDFPLKNAFNITVDQISLGSFTFISKFSSSGKLLFSSYLEPGYSSRIVLDSSGDYFITGTTGYGNFTIKNSSSPSFNKGNDIFIVRISPEDNLLYSSYFGGSEYDSSSGIAVDNSGAIYITGSTSSGDFPGLSCSNGTFVGSGFFFLVKFTLIQGTTPLLNSNGCTLLTAPGSIIMSPEGSRLTEAPTPGFSFISLGLVLFLLPLCKKKFGMKKK